MTAAARMKENKEAKVPEEAQVAPMSMELDDAEIAARAYSYWEARGHEGGSPEEDWIRAVEELQAERASGE